MMKIDGHDCIPVFAVQDVKCDIFYCTPLCNLAMDTDAAGIRQFIGMLRDNYFMHSWYNPHDYRLFRIGYFDIDDGQLVHELPELIFDGASLDISDWERPKIGGDSV